MDTNGQMFVLYRLQINYHTCKSNNKEQLHIHMHTTHRRIHTDRHTLGRGWGGRAEGRSGEGGRKGRRKDPPMLSMCQTSSQRSIDAIKHGVRREGLGSKLGLRTKPLKSPLAPCREGVCVCVCVCVCGGCKRRGIDLCRTAWVL